MRIKVSGFGSLVRMLSDLSASIPNQPRQQLLNELLNGSGMSSPESQPPSGYSSTTKYSGKLEPYQYQGTYWVASPSTLKAYQTLIYQDGCGQLPSTSASTYHNKSWSSPSPNSPSTPGGEWVSFSQLEQKLK